MKLTRFLKLERPRPERQAEEKPVDSALEERFRAERQAQLQSGIDVEARGPREQPFLRCPRCEADNSRFAVKCFNCMGELSSDEVRLWNERFWADRLTQMPAAAAPSEEELASKRALGEALAQQVAQTEKERLGALSSGSVTTPLGFRLLEAIPNPNVRFAAGLGCAGAAIACVVVAFQSRGSPMMEGGALLLAIVLISLFAPHKKRRWD